MSRSIIIGDIHGCYAEFEDLLEKIGPTAGDRIFLLGDLINRGSDSGRVIDLAIRMNCVSVIGNHEHRLLRYHRFGDRSILKGYDLPTLEMLQARHWNYIATMRTSLSIGDGNTLITHGGFLPHLPWTDQPMETVCRLKVLPKDDAIIPFLPKGRSAKGVHWSEAWPGPATVYYGHTPRSKVAFTSFAVGLDTACVYGNFLTACLLPDMELVQVRARRSYI